jgi:hypothetical protein
MRQDCSTQEQFQHDDSLRGRVLWYPFNKRNMPPPAANLSAAVPVSFCICGQKSARLLRRAEPEALAADEPTEE